MASLAQQTYIMCVYVYVCVCSQREGSDWVETCTILLSGLKGGPVELPVRQPDTTFRINVPISPADSTEILVRIQLKYNPHQSVILINDQTEQCCCLYILTYLHYYHHYCLELKGWCQVTENDGDIMVKLS